MLKRRLNDSQDRAKFWPVKAFELMMQRYHVCFLVQEVSCPTHQNIE